MEDTSDFMCQCKYPAPTTTQPTTTPVPTTQPTTTPAPQPTTQHPPGECLPPADWDPNFLDDACGDCTAKVHTKGKDGTYYRSCDMICDSIGHVCTHAAEDKNFGHCQEKNDNFRCSDDIGAMEDTSDFMCQCKYPAPTTTQPTTQPTQPTTTAVPDTVQCYTRLPGNCVTE